MRIQLYDTTLRDGTQGEGISFSADDKLRIAQRLDAFGCDYIEGGWPGSNPKDAEFFRLAQQATFRRARITAFGSTRRAGSDCEHDPNLQALLAAGVQAVAVFGKSWDFHVFRALRTTADENLAMIRDSVRYLRGRGLEVIYDAEHFFDGYKANPDYALATIEAAAEAGAGVIVLCDTNGGSLPHEIQEMVAVACRRLPGLVIGIHAHNDSGLGVANTLAAVQAGARHVQGTINGYGERCGNADLVQVIPNLQLKMGLACVDEEQLAQLTDLSRFVSEMANLTPDERRPFVGRSVFAHKGGIHVSALVRNPETYEHIRPELVGNRRRVLVSELSGASNVLYKAREYNIDVDPSSPALRQVVEQVKALEHEGYLFESAEASFELLLKRVLGHHRSYFELLGFRLVVEKERGAESVAEATVKVRVGGEVVHTAAEGNGPVNALDNALRKALQGTYPELAGMHLSDYKVRVIDESSGTGARVRVLIQSAGGGRVWGTVGVSANIIEASWHALVDSIEYGLGILGAEPAQAPPGTPEAAPRGRPDRPAAEGKSGRAAAV